MCKNYTNCIRLALHGVLFYVARCTYYVLLYYTCYLYAIVQQKRRHAFANSNKTKAREDPRHNQSSEKPQRQKGAFFLQWADGAITNHESSRIDTILYNPNNNSIYEALFNSHLSSDQNLAYLLGL